MVYNMLYNTKFHCSSTSPARLVPKHLASWSLEQPDVLLPVTIFLEINDLKVTFLYRAHELRDTGSKSGWCSTFCMRSLIKWHQPSSPWQNLARFALLQ